MKSWDFAMRVIDVQRATCPYLLSDMYGAGLSLFLTEGGSAQFLWESQRKAKAHPAPPQADVSLFPRAELSWWEIAEIGMTLSRRDQIHRLLAARTLIQGHIQATNDKLNLISPQRPFDPYAVWYLFVENRDTSTKDKSYFHALGKASMVSFAVGAESLDTAASDAVEALFTSLRRLTEELESRPY